MRMTAMVLVLTIGAVGCGVVTDDNPLAGTTWQTQVNSTDTLAVSFHSDGTYTQATVFSLAAGGFGADIERGRYTAGGGQLSVTPTQASCPSRSHTTDTVAFQIVGNNLSIDRPQGLVILQRSVTDGTVPGSTITYGCSSGSSFSPHDIVPL